jgi:rRNA-processing protein FCF1
VDAANVMGSRPNGWWRDRARAAAGLCTEMRNAVRDGRLADPVVVVLEGAARPGVPERDQDGLRIVHAPAGGDDTIVAVAADASAAGHTVTVVTADRGLRARVEQVGCQVVGPRWLLDRL